MDMHMDNHMQFHIKINIIDKFYIHFQFDNVLVEGGRLINYLDQGYCMYHK